MNAVNLIPVERRYSGVSAPGAPFAGLLGALVLGFAGTVAYVEAHSHVATRQTELSQVRTGVAEWSAAAARYTPAVSALKHRDKQFADLGILLGERYDWSVLLGQLAGAMPAHAELAAMSAATPSTSSGADASAPPATGTSTASGITISGCATSQSVVADTMIALRRLSGVSEVSLSSSTLQSGGNSSASGSAAAGNCTLPVNFSLTLEFAPAGAVVKMPGATGSAHEAQKASTTPSPSTSDSTGAAQ